MKFERSKYKDKESGIVTYVTDDYSDFGKFKGNRRLNANNVAEKKRKILQQGWFFDQVILVDEDMRVADGQHRLEALRQIQRESGIVYKIRYEVVEGITLEEIRQRNTGTKNWDTNAYLESNIELKNENYVILQEFKEQYKLNTLNAAMLLTNTSTHGKQFRENFKEGKFEIKDKDKAINEAHIRAAHILAIRKYFRGAKQTHFMQAMLYFWNHPKFNNEQFLHKLGVNRDGLYTVTSINRYKELIAELYNYKSRDKINFKF